MAYSYKLYNIAIIFSIVIYYWREVTGSVVHYLISQSVMKFYCHYVKLSYWLSKQFSFLSVYYHHLYNFHPAIIKYLISILLFFLSYYIYLHHYISISDNGIRRQKHFPFCSWFRTQRINLAIHVTNLYNYDDSKETVNYAGINYIIIDHITRK